MKEAKHKLLIKNMVCQRCILTVEAILARLDITGSKVNLGEVDLPASLPKPVWYELQKELHKVGFEIIETRINKMIEDIKKRVLDYIHAASEEQSLKLSAFITTHLHYDYSYLSDLFSSVEGMTIEQYFINQRIEKVKELLVYNELSLTSISYETGYSSVHHLSAQFKKVTGLTPSHFKKIGAEKRKSIDKA